MHNGAGMQRVFDGDTSLFLVPAELTEEDKRSLLSIHAAIHRQNKSFAYLEIGSYLGGSLQTFLLDELCHVVYSVDKRPGEVPDERGIRSYQGVDTETMLDHLRPLYAESIGKLRCFDTDARDVDRSQIDPAPQLLFVDGEHTKEAAFDDFKFCLSVAARPCVIFFHDAHLVFEGIENSLRYLDEQQVPYYAYNLPDFLCVIEVGRFGLFKDEDVLSRLLISERGIIRQLHSMAVYKDFYGRMNRNPAFLALRKMKTLLRV
jgi:Methyltransferase domain